MEQLGSILEVYPTPMYLYDQCIMERQKNTLLRHKPENLDVYYAMKGNSNLSILNYFRQSNLGVEIASGGELFLANQAKFSADKIIYTGPAKTDDELKYAVETGIKTIHVESLNEAKRLQVICKELGKQQSILVRINACFEVKTAIQLSGCPSPFGINEEDIFDVLPAILALDHLTFEGIHVYNASGILDFKLLEENVKNVFELVERLERHFDFNLSTIDFGGGLGIDYTDSNDHVDVVSFYNAMKEQIKKFGFESKHLIMEIARFLVAESGRYIAQVIDKKESRGETFIITDGGIQHFMRVALFGVNHSTKVIQRNPSAEVEEVNITGSLCTNIDVLAKKITLPKIEIGDYIVIEKAGCYGLNAAINNFLSHEMPLELLQNKDELKVIRARGRYEDLLLNQKNYD